MKKFSTVSVWLIAMIFALSACGGGGSASTESDVPVDDNSSAAAVAGETVTDEWGEYTTLPDDAPQQNWNYGDESNDGSVQTETVRLLSEMLDKRSGGKIKLTVHNALTLGSTPNEIFESTINGDIQLCGGAIGSTLNAEYSIFDMPGIYSNWDNAFALLREGPVFDYLREIMREKGTTLLYASARCYRVMTSSKPIETMDDVRGLNMRLPNNPTWLTYWSKLGANAVTVPMSEVYLALQQGMVEAQENSMEQIVTNNLLEVQKYLIYTNHVMDTYALHINNGIYDNLPAEERRLLDECVRDIRIWMDTNVEIFNDGFYARAEEQGSGFNVAFVEPTEAFMDSFAANADEQIGEVRAISDKSDHLTDLVLASMQLDTNMGK
jgi:TRAP-type C4-dicarboxylate transport system substrate-binding protein